jgi:hypothetical protein
MTSNEGFLKMEDRFRCGCEKYLVFCFSWELLLSCGILAVREGAQMNFCPRLHSLLGPMICPVLHWTLLPTKALRSILFRERGELICQAR